MRAWRVHRLGDPSEVLSLDDVDQPTPGPGQVTFAVGNETVAVGTDDCADPILFDFGPGSDAYFVYTRGRTVPKSGRRG